MGGIFSKDKPAGGGIRPCTEQVHSAKVHVCSSNNCQATVCQNCTQPIQGKLYCMLCAMSKQSDQMELDEEAMRKSKIKNTETTVTLKMDMDTGEISGF